MMLRVNRQPALFMEHVVQNGEMSNGRKTSVHGREYYEWLNRLEDEHFERIDKPRKKDRQ